MKGVVSFLYLFSVFAYLSVVLSVYLSVYERISYLEYNVFLLEDRISRELELKHAMKNVIAYSEELNEVSNILPAPYNQISQLILSDYGVNRLSDLESSGKYSYYNWRRFALDFWCGFPSNGDLVNAISLKGRAYPAFFNSQFICDNCFSVSSEVLTGTGPSSVCSFFLSSDPLNRQTRVGISNPGKFLSGGIEYDLADIFLAQNVKFGVLVYDSKENISSAVVIPGSTIIPWRNVSMILALEGVLEVSG